MAASATRVSDDPYLVVKTTRHGFPYRVSCMAYDPLQQLLAIGSHQGVVTILGRNALERRVEHSASYGVLQLQFGINRGLLLSLGYSEESDTAIFLWSFIDKNIVLLDKMKINREKLRVVYWPYISDWVYLGCESGNVHFVCVDYHGTQYKFLPSDDVIYWNKASQLRNGRRDNPGEVLCLEEHPLDPSKLLVGYSRGLCLIWDLKEKNSVLRYSKETTSSVMTQLSCVCWHSNGKTIVVGYGDGCVITVEVKTGQILEMLNVNTGGGMLNCLPIYGLQCYNAKDGPWVLFSGGGLLRDEQITQTLTVWSKTNVKELEFADSIVDFICLPSTPFPSEVQCPSALVVLTEQEVLAFDMKCDLQVESPPPIRLPFTLRLHPTPVTCLLYCGLCSADLEAQLVMITTKLAYHRTSQPGSLQVWPINGGEWDSRAIRQCPRLIVTGHQDGTVRFWLSYEDIFQPAFSVNTASYFVPSSPRQDIPKDIGKTSGQQSPKTGKHASRKSLASTTANILGVDSVKISLTQQIMCVVSERGDVLLFKIALSSSSDSVHSQEIIIKAEEEEDFDDPPPPSTREGWKFRVVQRGEVRPTLKLAQHCYCLLDNMDKLQMVRVNAVEYCPSNGMLIVGTRYGIAVVDTITKSCGYVITSVKKLMSLADYSWLGTVKRARLKSKHKLQAKQPFKLLTSRKGLASNTNPPEAPAASSSCEISLIVAVYLYLGNLDPTPSLTVWVGTATGQVAAFGVLEKGGSGDKRLELIPTGITIEKPSKVVDLLFLTDKMAKVEPITVWEHSGATPPGTLNYLMLATANLLKSYTLPKKNCVGRCQLSENMGEIISSNYCIIGDQALLITLLSSSQLLIYTLPELIPLAEMSSLPMKGPIALNTFSLCGSGRAAYMCSPTEVQEVTVLSSTADQSHLWKYLPQLYIPREEASIPKRKGLLSTILPLQTKQNSHKREQYFSVKTVIGPHLGARRTAGHASLTSSSAPLGEDMPDGATHRSQQDNGHCVSGPYDQLPQQLDERQEKLSKLAKTTSDLADTAGHFSNLAQQLAAKYGK